MMGGRVAAAGAPGFSLLELLVATACTGLVATAVFTLLVGSAATSRREWGALEARRLAGAAVAAVAHDLAYAGAGLEDAAAVQRDGQRIGYAAADAAGGLTVVLALGAAVEIREYGAGSRYTVDAGAPLRPGDTVAAVGSPDRPAGAPLPLGVVAAAWAVAAGVELTVAWRPAEAAVIATWGAPRALLAVQLRQYDTRVMDGAVQLFRRTDGGPRQPVVDGLESFAAVWLVDTDGDGRADTRRDDAPSAAALRLCAVELTASAAPSPARLAGAPPAPARAVESAESIQRWVTLRGCR